MPTAFWPENFEAKESFGNQAMGRRIILKSIVKKWDMRMWCGFIWLRIL